MSFTIQDYLLPATQKYYGVDVSSDIKSNLWTEFCSSLSNRSKEYLTIVSNTNIDDVQAAMTNFLQQAMLDLKNEGNLYDLTDQDVELLSETLSVQIVDNQVVYATGLISADPNVIKTVLGQIWDETGAELSTAQLALIARTTENIATIGASIPSQYISFLSDKTQALQQSTIALSPHEQEVRRIMFEIFSMALDMIRLLQNTNRLEANLLFYYSNVEREYVNMMSKIQMYGPNPVQFIVADSLDFGKTQLGYANITVRDIADYLVDEIKDTQGATEVTYSSVETGEAATESDRAPLEFALRRTADNGYIFEVRAYTKIDDTTYGYVPILTTERISDDRKDYSAANPVNDTSLYYVDPKLGGTEQSASLVNAFMHHLTHQWNETPDSTTLADYNYPSNTNTNLLMMPNAVPNDPPYQIATFADLKTSWSAQNTDPKNPLHIYFTGPAKIAWEDQYLPGTPSEDAKTKAKERATDFRSQQNALLQTYIQTASALKDIAGDASKRVDAAMTQIKESLQNQSDLCSAIVDSLRGLLSAIYR